MENHTDTQPTIQAVAADVTTSTTTASDTASTLLNSEQTHIVEEVRESLEEIAKSCNQLLDNPPDENYEKSELLLIRHGYSEYNHAMDRFKTTDFHSDFHSEKAREMRLNINDIDTPLHPIGLLQAQNSAKYVNAISDIHTVFVSPLLRTLQTTEALFKNHPNRENIKFIVMPEIAEGLSFSCSFAPLAFSEVRKAAYADFDFSRGEEFSHKATWQIEQVTCEKSSQEILNKMNTHKEDEAKLSEIYLQELDSLFPSYVETHDHLWQRAQKARSIITNYKKTLQPGQKVLVVAHYILLLFLTSSQRHHSFHDMDGVRCKNSKLLTWNP